MTDSAAPPAPPRRIPSITGRLFAAIGLLLLAGGVAITLAAFAYGQQAARDAFDRLLIGAANQISASIAIVDGEPLADLPVSALDLLALAGQDRIVYRIVGENGETLTGYDAPALPEFEDESLFFDGEFTGEAARFVAVKRQFAERGFSGAVTTIVGHTTRARTALAWDIARNAWLLLAAAGLGMVALAAFAIRSALAPLRRIQEELLARDPHDLTPLDVAVPSELSAVTEAINRFMGRLKRQIEGMQNLISDSAHQLRTPIAALRAQAELAADEPDPDRRERIVARIHNRSVELTRLTDQILNRALIIHRADSEPHEWVDLRKVAMRAAESFDDGTLFEEGRLRLDLAPASAGVIGDRLSLEEAAKNFISNALTHGEGTVTVSAARHGDYARLAVSDEGKGPPSELLGELGTRFTRGKSGGSGLGLAIARAVATAHRGRLDLGRTEEGQFEIALILPLVAEKKP